LGIGGYLGTGRASVTALIPAFFGLPLLVLGVLALSERRRKVAMHIAVVLGVLGFAGTVSGLLKLPALLTGGTVARPAAVAIQSAMAIACFLFVVLCIQSFIKARRK
jgi:NAD/NADP transhydrogenase beta subunit